MIDLNGFTRFDNNDWSAFGDAHYFPDGSFPQIRYAEDFIMVVDGNDDLDNQEDFPFRVFIYVDQEDDCSVKAVSFCVSQVDAVEFLTDGLRKRNATQAFTLLASLGGEVC